ncbi:hypothetical protein ACFE04_007718 [Oxalis oulophora]
MYWESGMGEDRQCEMIVAREIRNLAMEGNGCICKCDVAVFSESNMSGFARSTTKWVLEKMIELGTICLDAQHVVMMVNGDSEESSECGVIILDVRRMVKPKDNNFTKVGEEASKYRGTRFSSCIY